MIILMRNAAFVVILLAALQAHAEADSVTPGDVFVVLGQLAEDVRLVSLEMGVKVPKQAEIAIQNAQPREVYFQVLTMHQKSNRLLFDVLREREDAYPVSSNMTPLEVLAVVRSSSEIIQKVKAAMGIPEQNAIVLDAGEVIPTEVFRMVVQINRELNLLLRQRFSPAESYQQITHAMSYASRILGTIPNADPIGDDPGYERRKTPTDVYRRLLAVYSELHETFRLSGLMCLTIAPSEYKRTDVEPSEVYDLASILVSELAHLHSRIETAAPPRESFYPGEKLPSHVYQRSGRLALLIAQIHNHALAHPDWLDP